MAPSLFFILSLFIIVAVNAGKTSPPPPTPTPVSTSTVPAGITYYLTGNAQDVSSAIVLGGPVLDLAGGGTDVDVAFQSAIDKVRGCSGLVCTTKVDIVIVRVTGADGYNPSLIALNGVDSVETLVITTVSAANSAFADSKIKAAELVFYAGGDQCNYVSIFKGTKVESATEWVYARGGAIGGTSAGMAIQGPFVFDACQGTIDSLAALRNPYDRSVSLSNNFFAWNFMQNIITDQHFVVRDRMGRALTFLARLIKDGNTTTAWAVAANEETSVVVDKLGLATVVANDGIFGGNPIPPASLNAVAYFILLDTMPTQCVTKKALSASGYKVWKRVSGATFNLAQRPIIPDYTLNVVNGVISVVGNGGNIY